jgi:SAM-dependent methyltransferase
MTQLLQQQATQRYYDSYPFIEGGAKRIAWWREYLRDFFPDDAVADRLIVDVGSSVGEISRGLLDRGARMVCLDLSGQSLRRCRQINPEAELFHGSALELPFADESFDHAISIGVLMVTPDCRRGFKEVARVLAPGGTLVVFIYSYWNWFNLVYQGFAPIRKTFPLSRIPGWMAHSMQPFVRWHLGQTLNEPQLRRLLGDKLWTPHATFHSVREVCRWGTEEGLTFIANKKFFLGYANVMCFRKQGKSGRFVRREVTVKCLRCGNPSMYESDDRYTCTKCGHVYLSGGGIFESIMP